MMHRRINADKPHLWKADVAASVDQFNQWFMRFAPEAFRSTRVKTTEHVKGALLATNDLRNIDRATLKDNPSALSTLRMCTAPPLAVDRLIGLAEASKNLVCRMEDGKLPTKMNGATLGALSHHLKALRPRHLSVVGRHERSYGHRTRPGVNDRR